MTPDADGDRPDTDSEDWRDPEAGDAGADQPSASDAGRQTGRPQYVQAAEEMGWQGWLLVGLVCLCFLVIPVLILFIPQASGFIDALGFSQRQAFLAFPMIPAILLGITAVWAALRTQRTREQ